MKYDQPAKKKRQAPSCNFPCSHLILQYEHLQYNRAFPYHKDRGILEKAITIIFNMLYNQYVSFNRIITIERFEALGNHIRILDCLGNDLSNQNGFFGLAYFLLDLDEFRFFLFKVSL